MSEDGFVEQFKTVDDLQIAIDRLIAEHRVAKNKELGVMFRVVVPPNEPTTYQDGSQGPYRLVHGVRVGDYTFDTSLEWVLPDPAAGLSFSKSFSHLKSTWKLLRRHARGKDQPGPVNVAYFNTSKKFKDDQSRHEHY